MSRVESPFTKTPLRRLSSRLGFGLEGARNQIRAQRSTEKKAIWKSRATLLASVELTKLSFAQAEELIFGGDSNKHDDYTQPILVDNLYHSDANQGEINFLTGISKKDPRPMHRINYDSDQPREEDVAVSFRRGSFGILQETIGEAQYRAEKARERNTNYINGNKNWLRERIKRRIYFAYGNKRIPLFSRRQTIIHYMGPLGH